MFSKTWIISLFLAVGVIFFGIRAIQVWSDVEQDIPEAGSRQKQSDLPSSKKAPTRNAQPPESDYEVVVNKNLFWPDRSEYGAQKTEKQPEKKSGPDERLLKILQETVKRISIYGIIMLDGEKKALIRSSELPITGRRRNHKQPPTTDKAIKWVTIGDAVNRFTVTEIKPTGVVLKAEGLDFEIVLYDEDTPKQRSPEKRGPGPIVIDTDKGPEAGLPPRKSTVPREKIPVSERKLPFKAGQKAPASKNANQESKPEKK